MAMLFESATFQFAFLSFFRTNFEYKSCISLRQEAALQQLVLESMSFLFHGFDLSIPFLFLYLISHRTTIVILHFSLRIFHKPLCRASFSRRIAFRISFCCYPCLLTILTFFTITKPCFVSSNHACYICIQVSRLCSVLLVRPVPISVLAALYGGAAPRLLRYLVYPLHNSSSNLQL